MYIYVCVPYTLKKTCLVPNETLGNFLFHRKFLFPREEDIRFNKEEHQIFTACHLLDTREIQAQSFPLNLQLLHPTSIPIC